MKKDYCTQNNGDCYTCSLVNYGRDCRNNPLLFEFTESQYREFKTMLENLNKENWGLWDNRKWLKFPGMPGYAIHQYIQTNEKTFVVVKFDELVLLPDNRKGKRFKVGGQRNYQPVCERF